MVKKLRRRCCKVTLPHRHCACRKVLLSIPSGEVDRGTVFADSVADKARFERGDLTLHDVLNRRGQRISGGLCETFDRLQVALVLS